MIKLRCLIVDDEELSRTTLEKLVRHIDSFELVQTCSSPLDAHKVLQKQKVDLIFLDVEMPEMNGVEFVRSLKDKPEIILVTSKENYAVEAFDLEVADYLVKPVTVPRFLKAVNRILARHSEGERFAKGTTGQEMLYVKVNTQLVKVPIPDVLWVEATGDYVTIHTERENFIAHSTMKGMEGKLPAGRFMRVHRSYIVQLPKIKAVEENLIIIGKALIPIGDSYRSALMRLLNTV